MMQYLKNIKIYHETRREFTHGRYKDTPHVVGIPYQLDISRQITHLPRYGITRVEVIHEDTLAGCQNLKQEGVNPVGLIFANQHYPGGGVDRGCLAQEENVFRRSNCYFIMPQKFYSLSSVGGLYLPQVVVIKDKNYELLAETHTTAMIVSAAICDPKLDANGRYATPEDRKIMEDNIRQIFQIAYDKQHDSLVLGAYGLGAFNNSVEDILSLFNQVIKEYWGCFKVIRFSIIDFNTQNYNHFKNNIIRQENN